MILEIGRPGGSRTPMRFNPRYVLSVVRLHSDTGPNWSEFTSLRWSYPLEGERAQLHLIRVLKLVALIGLAPILSTF